jgi:APA family basic amino acid/polyamine antiporter
VVDTLVAMGIILFLMMINVIGVRESSRLNIMFICIDIATQITIVVLGVVLILKVHPEILVQNMFGTGNWPTAPKLILGIAIAALCFTGVETVSQLAEETRRPAERIPQAYVLMTIAVLVLFAGISVVALSAMTPQILGDPVNGWARDPVAGIAANLPSETLQSIFAPLVAILAASILLTATNAGLLGISRLAFNLSSHKQLPASFGKVHTRFKTPYLAILFFCMIAIFILIPGLTNPDFFTELGALYVFGSLLCFAFAHAAIIGLRIKRPDLSRPFKIGFNINFKKKPIPLTALLGLIATSSIWVVVVVTQPFSRYIGIIWMAGGIIFYYLFKKLSQRKDTDFILHKVNR